MGVVMTRRMMVVTLVCCPGRFPVRLWHAGHAFRSTNSGLIRNSADKDVENTKRKRITPTFGAMKSGSWMRKGRVKSTESKTYEMMVLAGEHAEKLIAKDDKPLSEKDARKEDEKIQKMLPEAEKESERDRRRSASKIRKGTEEERQFVREVADAYQVSPSGHGKPRWSSSLCDRCGAPTQLQTSTERREDAAQIRLRLWIDKAEQQWVKFDIECIDTISWGFSLRAIHKGSTIHVEQTRVNDEVWLPKHLALKLDARIALLKNFDVAYDITFRDYQKFRTDAIIRPLGEVNDGR